MLRCEALTIAATWMHPENTMLSERSQTQKDTQGVTPTEEKQPEQVDPQSQSGFLVVRGRRGEGMITKGVRDSFGVREMFQNRAVVMAAHLSKVSPHAPVQHLRGSF